MSNARVRHNRLRNDKVITPFGDVSLDSKGYVSNLETIKGGAEALLGLPNFLDGNVFPAVEDLSTSTSPKTADQIVDEVKNPATQPSTPPQPVVPTTDPKSAETPSTTDSKPAAPSTPTGGSHQTAPSRKDYWDVIKAVEEIKKNSAGYADSTTVMQKLREKGYPLISGSQVREITEEFRPKASE